MQKDNNPYLARLGANISAKSQGGINARNNEATGVEKLHKKVNFYYLSGWVFLYYFWFFW